MKRVLTMLLLALRPMLAADTGAMNDTERAYLVQQLETSKKQMLESIDGLSPAQWTFKPAPGVWSVQECAEHIVLAEGYMFSGSQKMLQTPAVARPATSNPESDQKLVAAIKDRSAKHKAPEPIVPSGKFPTPGDAAKAFTEARDKSIAYVKSTNDDLRTHMTQGPAGPMDAYQLLLLMAAHSMRHTDQIREVEANAAYPKAAAMLLLPR